MRLSEKKFLFLCSKLPSPTPPCLSSLCPERFLKLSFSRCLLQDAFLNNLVVCVALQHSPEHAMGPVPSMADCLHVCVHPLFLQATHGRGRKWGAGGRGSCRIFSAKRAPSLPPQPGWARSWTLPPAGNNCNGRWLGLGEGPFWKV